MLNINAGRNQELLDKCKKLGEYAMFVETLRRHTLQYPERLDLAVRVTVQECIQRDILKEFLISSEAEVLEMVLYEFDQELHDKTTRADGYEEGYEAGKQEMQDALEAKEKQLEAKEQQLEAKDEEIERLRKLLAEK